MVDQETGARDYAHPDIPTGGESVGSEGDTDPENRLLARANVRRLEAEAIRDAMLQASGSLDRSPLGGPGQRGQQQGEAFTSG